MNPNQPNNFQPYSPQFKTNQYNNYQYSNQPNQTHFTQNTLNIPRNNFQQPVSLSPTDGNQVNRNRIERTMYSSTIQGTLPSKNFTFGKLQSMGRFIGNNDQSANQQNKPSFEFSQSMNGQNREFNYQNQKPKQFEPQGNNNRVSQFDRFPSFNLQDNHMHQQNIPNNNFHPQPPQDNHKLQGTGETLTPEEKRRKQILAIKQQLEMINKKMQSTNLSKKFTPENQKNDTKPTQTPTITVNNNNFLNPNNLNTNTTSYTSSSSNQNTQNTGLTFARSNQLNVGQRSKGMVAQSMIVSTEPSPGYKYQSIFDKYDSLKKPTFETSNLESKEDRPSLLDKFVNKGPGSQSPKENQFKPFQPSNIANTSSNISNNLPSYEFKSSSKTNESISNSFTSSYSSSTSSSSSTSTGTGLTFANTNSEAPKEGGGMFKKKKANFTQEIKIQSIINNINPPQQSETFTFKKSQQQNSQNNFITNAMKQMKIEESVEFKRDDFVVGKKLGKGQFGQVMLVQHKKTGFLCGMKVMQKKQIRDQKYQGQIARQLSIQFYLAHRNIAPLYGYFQDQKNVYLLVEYCTGGQLLQLLRKNRRMQQPQVSRIIRQIIEGIDYIHKELIIHRDIKPENILFNFGVAKICDYGWAVYKGHGMRKTASVGSPLYYSPQIVMGVQYDQKIDIWDIGMMTYECLLGKIPFRIYSELDLNRIVQDEIKFPQYIDTTEEAKDFILKIMKKKPQERMQIRQMLRHPFITKYQDPKLPIQIMKDFKQVLSS